MKKMTEELARIKAMVNEMNRQPQALYCCYYYYHDSHLTHSQPQQGPNPELSQVRKEKHDGFMMIMDMIKYVVGHKRRQIKNATVQEVRDKANKLVEFMFPSFDFRTKTDYGGNLGTMMHTLMDY
jgi:hypothetical protein